MALTFTIAEQLRASWARARGPLIEELQRWQAEIAALYDGKISMLGLLTTNGFVKTINGDGTLVIDTNTYLTATDLAGLLETVPNVAVRLTNADLVGTTTVVNV